MPCTPLEVSLSNACRGGTPWPPQFCLRSTNLTEATSPTFLTPQINSNANGAATECRPYNLSGR